MPIVLFHAAPECDGHLDHSIICTRLKNSLSETLTRFYPLGGMIKGDVSIDLSYEAVTFTEAQASIQLSHILRNPKMDILQQFLPFDPYVLAIQVTILGCGGLGIGVYISHKITDGATLASFLCAWATTARRAFESIVDPLFYMATLFPPSDHLHVIMPTGLFSKQKIVTKRFVFDATSLATLKDKAAKTSCINNRTHIESVTALLCKSAMNSTSGKSGKAKLQRIISHVVNLREKMVPKLPGYAFGNLWRNAIASIAEGNNKIELPDIVVQLRTAIRKINEEYVRKLQVCTSNAPIKNVVILMGTRSGDGTEAWVSMDEQHKTKFEREEQLLQYAFSPQPYCMTQTLVQLAYVYSNSSPRNTVCKLLSVKGIIKKRRCFQILHVNNLLSVFRNIKTT
ncbi:hypothetical protein PVL29_001257 [Vitis rotundifolia]|uniref:Uncharacterized protein n=1 Tax=Vitis rotundifolia TaxID=103349 RepID=A0AA39E632_VITRO|nr:hypothetical protein PVL29_001257 [Vitis rotundifolia]